MKHSEIKVYTDLLSEIKLRLHHAQIKAAFSANTEMLAMYWDIGKMIYLRQQQKGWGAKIIPNLQMI